MPSAPKLMPRARPARAPPNASSFLRSSGMRMAIEWMSVYPILRALPLNTGLYRTRPTGKSFAMGTTSQGLVATGSGVHLSMTWPCLANTWPSCFRERDSPPVTWVLDVGVRVVSMDTIALKVAAARSKTRVSLSCTSAQHKWR